MSAKVLIFGRGGQLGAELVRVFTEREMEVVAFARVDVDVTDAARVDQIVGDLSPSVVLNATAYNLVDKAETEPEAAFAGNSAAVRNLALACRHADARLVHFSTDYVFDGTAGRAYTEDDAVHPLGTYAVSKLAGEHFAQAYLENSLVIRTCGVYGIAGMLTARGNFVETMLRLAQQGKPIRVVQDSVASPTYAPALAERTADLVKRGLSGIFHGGGGQAITWFDFAKTIFEEAGVHPELLPTSEKEFRTPARRPRYSALSNAKMEGCGIAPMPPLRDCVGSYLASRTPAAKTA